jgi:hypothetical protein
MGLSTFLSEMLDDRGLHPHQVSIVTDNLIAQAGPLSLPRTKTLGGSPSRNARNQLGNSLRRTLSDPALVLQMRHGSLSRCNSTVDNPCDSQLLLKKPDSTLQKGRSRSNASPWKNSTWNTMDLCKGIETQNGNNCVLPRDSLISLQTKATRYGVRSPC